MTRQQIFTLRLVFHNFYLVLKDSRFVLADLLVETFLGIVRQFERQLDATYKVNHLEQRTKA